MQGKTIHEDKFLRMRGSELTLDWLNSNGDALKEPIVIENPEGLGMTMPEAGFEVRDILDILSEETPVEVIGMYLVQFYPLNVLTLSRCRYSI